MPEPSLPPYRTQSTTLAAGAIARLLRLMGKHWGSGLPRCKNGPRRSNLLGRRPTSRNFSTAAGWSSLGTAPSAVELSWRGARFTPLAKCFNHSAGLLPAVLVPDGDEAVEGQVPSTGAPYYAPLPSATIPYLLWPTPGVLLASNTC